MNTNLKGAALALLALVSTLGSSVALAELAIIAHPANLAIKATRSELSDLYLGRSESLANDEEAVPVDQPAASLARQQFIKGVLNMDEGQLKGYWAKLMFSGKAQPPKSLANDQEVKEWVANNPDAIGYIDGKSVDKSVKVLLTLP